MRELTVRVRFTTPCLGNVKDRTGRFLLPRSPDGLSVLFQASWHQSNMALASQLLGRHQDTVRKIMWDVRVDGLPRRSDRWHRIYYPTKNGRDRYFLHEAFKPGQVIGLNCTVPNAISDEDFWTLVQKAGQYKGLSPLRAGEFGLYDVVGVRPRRSPETDTQELNLLPHEADIETKRAD